MERCVVDFRTGATQGGTRTHDLMTASSPQGETEPTQDDLSDTNSKDSE